MAVKVGPIKLTGNFLPIPRRRAQIKADLKEVARNCGVEGVYFVRTAGADYGGYYNIHDKRIIVVERQGSYQVPMSTVIFRFFHELTHHLHMKGGIFLAYYLTEAKIKYPGKSRYRKVKYTPADQRRAALRAERHANKKACELADQFFGLELEAPEYPREYLWDVRSDIF